MFDFRNGEPVMERLVPKGLAHAATSFVESLKINSITEKARRDGRVVIKRRKIYNEKTGRARPIDFEIRHEKLLPATAVTPMTCSFSCSIWWAEFRVVNGSGSRSVFCAPTGMPRSCAN